MKQLCLVLGLFLGAMSFSSSSFAQKIKVKKIKGNQAIVEFPASSPLQPGRVYELNSVDDMGTSQDSDSESRNHVIALSFSFASYKSNTVGATNDSLITGSGKYGWNLGSVEFGPVVSVQTETTSGLTSTSLLGGVFGDYNLIPNSSGEIFIYGLGAIVDFGTASNGQGTNTTTEVYYVGPFVKWFPFGNAVGLRFDADYNYKSKTATVAAAYTGFVFLTGIFAYY